MDPGRAGLLVSPFGNARSKLLVAGDFMSASTILGVAGPAFSGNSDAVVYIVAPLLGFTIMLLFIAEQRAFAALAAKSQAEL
jgi:Na+(H+)/acetate symporter ActP